MKSRMHLYMRLEEISLSLENTEMNWDLNEKKCMNGVPIYL